MPQIFHRSTNGIARATLFGGAGLVVLAAWLAVTLQRSSYATGRDVVRDQPIPFSHAHHVGGLGIACRFCHVGADVSPFAGMPDTATCMRCHAEVWKDAPALEPLRAAWRGGDPVSWTRVHDLPDFVAFDHAAHVSAGVACGDCHGDVERMPLMRQSETLQMEWCLDCHRHPEPATGRPDPASTSCSACHR